jgi:hypothetical protein
LISVTLLYSDALLLCPRSSLEKEKAAVSAWKEAQNPKPS